MIQPISHLKNNRSSSSKHKISKQLFAESSQIVQQKKDYKQTQQNQNVFNYEPSTQTSRQFCKAYRKQITQNSHQKAKMKNQQSSEYIRNLYKKYLGKQNSNQTHSQRKLRTDVKQNKKTLVTQTYRQNDDLSSISHRKQKISSIMEENLRYEKNDSFKKQFQQKSKKINEKKETKRPTQIQPMFDNQNNQFQRQNKTKKICGSRRNQASQKQNWYINLLNDDTILNMIESQGSSILTALKSIKKFKQVNFY